MQKREVTEFKMNGNKNRLAILFFYDPAGIVDRYVIYYLNALKECAGRILVVVNGRLTPEGREKLSAVADDIIVRENKGFDVWAYKTAFEYVGWEELRKYYEVIIANDTVFGPVYPFSEMFDEMDKQEDLDFWGITRHAAVDANPFNSPYGYIPEHVQSYFTVYRNKFLCDRELESFWADAPEVNSYEESVGLYEVVFTKHFADKGCRWTTYVDDSAEKETAEHIVMTRPLYAIKKYRCPIFKRRLFFQDHAYFITNNTGEQTVELAEYIKNNTDYDFDMVWESIIRLYNQGDVARNLALNYILPRERLLSDVRPAATVALASHFYCSETVDEFVDRISVMPARCDIYITAPGTENIELLKEKTAHLPNKVEIRRIENRGGDLSALLTGCRDLSEKYDYICLYHDKAIGQIKPYSVGLACGYLATENMLSSEIYVENVISAFENNPKLGMLSPSYPHHHIYFSNLGDPWGTDYDGAVELAKKLGLNVPIDRNVPHVTPPGACFWFRSAAMKKLFDVGREYEDYPPEPNAPDGTPLHMLERLFPFVVQDAGYYPAFTYSDKFAAIQLANYQYYLHRVVSSCREHGIYGTGDMILTTLSNTLEEVTKLRERVALLEASLIARQSFKTRVRLAMRKHFPRRLYGFIVRAKRRIFGPRDLGYSYDESPWEEVL